MVADPQPAPVHSPRRRRWWRAVRALVVIGAVGVGAVYLFQDRLLYPAPGASRPWGNFHLARPNHLTLRGWVTRPTAPDAWVVFGGNAMAVSPLAETWATCTPRALYLVPYRGYEGQAGAPREADLVADGVAVVHAAQAAHANVGVIGISLGSGVATQVAALTRVDRVLLVTPYDRLDRVASAHVGGLPLGWLMHDHYDSAQAVARLKGVPVALLQADRDEVVPAARTAALVHALPQPPWRYAHAPTTHNGVWSTPHLCVFIQAGSGSL